MQSADPDDAYADSDPANDDDEEEDWIMQSGCCCLMLQPDRRSILSSRLLEMTIQGICQELIPGELSNILPKIKFQTNKKTKILSQSKMCIKKCFYWAKH